MAIDGPVAVRVPVVCRIGLDGLILVELLKDPVAGTRVTVAFLVPLDILLTLLHRALAFAVPRLGLSR